MKMQFRGKLKQMHYAGADAPEYSYFEVPKVTRAHCDMAAFRSSRKYGSYANSDLFLGMMERALRSAGVISSDHHRRLRLDALPACVSVDTSGFLAVVAVTLPDA